MIIIRHSAAILIAVIFSIISVGCQSNSVEKEESRVVVADLTKIEGFEQYGELKIEIDPDANTGNDGIIWVIEFEQQELYIIDLDRMVFIRLCFEERRNGINWYGPCPSGPPA